MVVGGGGLGGLHIFIKDFLLLCFFFFFFFFCF